MEVNLVSKEDKIMWNIYVELYEKSTPKGDFKYLVEHAFIDENGRKVIPFMDYEIDADECYKIINKHIPPKMKKYRKEMIKNSIILGCSPKFTKKI